MLVSSLGNCRGAWGPIMDGRGRRRRRTIRRPSWQGRAAESALINKRNGGDGYRPFLFSSSSCFSPIPSARFVCRPWLLCWRRRGETKGGKPSAENCTDALSYYYHYRPDGAWMFGRAFVDTLGCFGAFLSRSLLSLSPLGVCSVPFSFVPSLGTLFFFLV